MFLAVLSLGSLPLGSQPTPVSSEVALPALAEPSEDHSPGQPLDCDPLKDLEPEPPFAKSPFRILDAQKQHEIMNFHCFKPLRFGVLGNTAIDH